MKKFKNSIITALLLVIFIFCGYKIVHKFYTDSRAEATYSELRELNEDNNSNSGQSEEQKEDLKENLSHINEDFKFWITVDNTDLEYPVLQSEDNDYYLKRDINKQTTSAGAIYLDYRDDVDYSQNLILYGHNMKNGTMFAPIIKYKSEDFWKQNNKIRIYNGPYEYVYEVYAVCAVDADTFDYLYVDFETQEDFLSYVNKIKDKALYKTDMEISENDKIITLSTCSYEYKNGRTFVQGKLVEIN